MSMWSVYIAQKIKTDNELISYIHKGEQKNCYERLNQIIIGYLEYFTRTLARQFTLGNLGDEAKKCTGIISKFLFLQDSDLGKTSY